MRPFSLILLFSVIFFFNIQYSQSSTGAKNAQKYEEAVVKITVTLQSIPMTFGTGFFVSQDGLLVTNHHVIKESFTPGFHLSIKTKSGQEFLNYDVLGCSDERNIDLCLLKVNFKPKSFFQVSTKSISKGEDIFTWGHPRGYDYSLSTGIVSGIHKQDGFTKSMIDDSKTPKSIEMVQISAPISPGNSGGPVFDENGSLVGMATWVRIDKGSQNLNFAISVNELANYIKTQQKVYSLADWKKLRLEKTNQAAAKLQSQIIDPQFKRLAIGQPLDPKYFPMSQFTFDGVNYSLPIGSGGDCIKLKGDAFKIRCQFARDTFLIYEIFKGKPGTLKAAAGTKAKPEPLRIVREMQKEGSWEAISKNLTVTQYKYLHSIPSEVKCFPVTKSAMQAIDGNDFCIVSNYNDEEPNQSTLATLVQSPKTNHVVKIMVTTPDEGDMLKFWFGLAEVILKGAQWQAPSALAENFSMYTEKFAKIQLTELYVAQKAYMAEFDQYSLNLKEIDFKSVEPGIVTGFTRACARQLKLSDGVYNTAELNNSGRVPASEDVLVKALEDFERKNLLCRNPKMGFIAYSIFRTNTGFRVLTVNENRKFLAYDFK